MHASKSVVQALEKEMAHLVKRREEVITMIANLENALHILSSTSSSIKHRRTRGVLSPEGRANIVAGQKLRWAKYREEKGTEQIQTLH